MTNCGGVGIWWCFASQFSLFLLWGCFVCIGRRTYRHEYSVVIILTRVRYFGCYWPGNNEYRVWGWWYCLGMVVSYLSGWGLRFILSVVRGFMGCLYKVQGKGRYYHYQSCCDKDVAVKNGPEYDGESEFRERL